MENMSSILFMRDLMILQFRYKKRTHSNNVLLTFTSVLQLQCFAPVQQFISFIWSLFLYHVTFIETRHAHGFHYSLCHTVNDLVHWRDPKKSGVVFGVSCCCCFLWQRLAWSAWSPTYCWPCSVSPSLSASTNLSSRLCRSPAKDIPSSKSLVF